MTKHGLQIQNEFRYLTRNSQGRLEFEVLPSDRQQNGDQRASGIYQHSQIFNPLWAGYIDVRGISDKNYFEDFSDHLGVTSQTHLPQNAELNYRGTQWTFSARAADYQTIDRTIPPAARPYARLPQLNLLLNRPVVPNRVNYYFESEATYFERDTSVNGIRLSTNPAVGYPMSNSYSYLTPKIGLRSIGYQLLDNPADDSPSLTRGVFSLDGGLFFERDAHWGGRAYVQTLEPRLFYLYIPGKNQDTLPNFDTGLPEFTYTNLFRENRFSGGDRVGDSNQITAAVTTRFIDEENGNERARASIGRIYYFSDREVSLPAGTSTAAASDIVGEATATLVGNWHARANAQWNRQENQAQKYSYYLQYNPAKDRIVNFGKRFSRDPLDQLNQTDISAEWPISGRWTFRARSLYSLREHRNVESYAGAEYSACCWAVRFLAGKRLSIVANNDATQDTHIMFEFQLTGLSKLGKLPDSPLLQSVFSFPSRYPAPGSTIP
jgi:LPS-assembly protein